MTRFHKQSLSEDELLDLARRYGALVMGCLLLLLMMGYALRASRLAEFPPGVSRDEATNVVDIAIVAQTGRIPFYQDIERPEPFNRLYGAIASILFGNTIFAFRYTSVLWGMLSLAAVYWTSQQCFADQPKQLRQLIGVVAVASLVVALGHIAINRSIYRAVPLIIFVAVAAGFTCRAFRTCRRREYVLSGLFLAFGFYTYSTGMVVPFAYLPLVLQLAIFRRRRWRQWLPGLLMVALVLFILTLPISILLITQPQAILARAIDVGVGSPVDYAGRLETMIAQFLTEGDENPQYNIANAALVAPVFVPLFLVGVATLLLRIKQPASVLILGLLVTSAIPTFLTNEITHGLRIYGAYAVIPLVTGAGIILPLNFFARFSRSRWRLPLSVLAAIMALALYGAVSAQRVYVDFWTNADTNWRRWRVHGLELSHNEWFFRADRKRLADWIADQSSPLLIPQSDLNDALMRALLLADYPNVQAALSEYPLPADTQLIIPWSLEQGGFPDYTAHLALLQGDSIRLLPPLTSDASRRLYLDGIDTFSLGNPGSNIPVIARVQALPPGWHPDYAQPSLSGTPLARFNDELEIRALYGPMTIPGVGDYTFTVDWSVMRPVSHEYGGFMQILSSDWDVIAGEDSHLLRWLYPTIAWQEGEIVSKSFTLSIDQPLRPGAYRLVAGSWYINGGKLPAESFVGQATGNIASIAWLKAPQEHEQTIPLNAVPIDAVFAEQFQLQHVSAEREDENVLLINLYWKALASRPPIDATVFVHAVDENGSMVAQSDKRPSDGRYPTFIWDEGELVATGHRLELPRLEGIQLVAGMYTQPDFVRLPAWSKGERLPEDVANLGELVSLLAESAG